MGGFGSKHPNATHELTVRTGDKKGSGARNVNVYVTFTDYNGVVSDEVLVTDGGYDDFTAGQEATVHVEIKGGLTRIKEMTIRRDQTGEKDNWYVEKIAVKEKKGTEVSIFPIHRWIKSSTTLSLVEYDSSLPQLDKNAEQRKRELEDKRDKYLLAKKTILGAPPQVEILPEDEQFSTSYTFDIVGEALKIKLKTLWVDWTNKEFKSLADVEHIYQGMLPVPEGINKWRSDEEFGNQKLSGCNPGVIELCRKIPDHMPVTHTMVAAQLEGQKLDACVAAKKIYMLDLRFLDGIECSNHRRLPGPTCLLYVRKNGDLVPIAIQLMPVPAADNPIFTPNDPENVWLYAKMWFNMADANFHQSATHLGFTHLLKESVAVVSHRQLSPSHPIFRLLAPHFIYLLPINALAISSLVSPGGWVDKAMHCGRTGMFNIIGQRWDEWTLEKDGNVVKHFKINGTDDVKALPNYHYRDDATLLWNAIENFVGSVVKSAYDSAQKMKDDYEIQNWLAELKKDAGFKGFPESFTNNAQLTEVVTTFIFIGSVQHAAANFGQYDEYAFPPNYPSDMHTDRPTTKEDVTEEYLVKSLPNKDQTLDIVTIMKVLSARGTQPLGDYEVQYGYDPAYVTALDGFKKELAGVAATIDKRNEQRVRKYPYLNPREIPNAISI